MINRKFTPGCMYILQDLNDKIIFLAIACKKSDARVYIALQRIDWALFELQTLNDFISINVFHDWFFQWHKQL